MASGNWPLSKRAAALAALLVGLHGGSVLAKFVWDEPPAQTASAPSWAGPTSELADGDLIFRRGRDAPARVVLSQGDNVRFSHVGVIVVQDGKPFVVHAAAPEGDAVGGVVMEPLNDFITPDKAADAGVYRAKGRNARERKAIGEYARSQIGKPFDYEFRYSEDDTIYCTELALKSLNAGGADLQHSTRTVSFMMLPEPAFPPDYLRRTNALESL